MIARATKSIYIFVQHTNNKIVVIDFRHFRYLAVDRVAWS